MGDKTYQFDFSRNRIADGTSLFVSKKIKYTCFIIKLTTSGHYIKFNFLNTNFAISTSEDTIVDNITKVVAYDNAYKINGIILLKFAMNSFEEELCQALKYYIGNFGGLCSFKFNFKVNQLIQVSWVDNEIYFKLKYNEQEVVVGFDSTVTLYKDLTISNMGHILYIVRNNADYKISMIENTNPIIITTDGRPELYNFLEQLVFNQYSD
jgi:hypothetical protein